MQLVNAVKRLGQYLANRDETLFKIFLRYVKQFLFGAVKDLINFVSLFKRKAGNFRGGGLQAAKGCLFLHDVGVMDDMRRGRSRVGQLNNVAASADHLDL